MSGKDTMNTIRRFFRDIKKYLPYAVKAGRASLKSDVAESHLSWLWWILDPLLFMLVYTFVALIIFGRGEQYFSAFIFIGYTSYKFFETTLKKSVRLVNSNKSIVKNVYVPKIVLMFTQLYVNGFKSAVSFVLVFITMAIYKVPITWKVVYFIPLIFLLVSVSLGLGSILLHFGVYIDDLSNIINITLRLVFYMSGVFYSIDNRVKNELLRGVLLKLNPMAFIISQLRECLLYDGKMDYLVYFAWLGVAFLLLYVGVTTIYKNENGYVKVI